jgi:hypothetical protein
MRRFVKIAVLLSLVGGLAVAGPAGAGAETKKEQETKRGQEPRGRHREPADVSFIGINNHGHARSGHHFSPAHLSTLVVVVSWQTLVGLHTQRLELVTPDGSMYQAFTAEVGSVDGRARVETPVRVAGTWITEYQLFGHWTVNVYLDGQPTPAARGFFTLSH